MFFKGRVSLENDDALVRKIRFTLSQRAGKKGNSTGIAGALRSRATLEAAALPSGAILEAAALPSGAILEAAALSSGAIRAKEPWPQEIDDPRARPPLRERNTNGAKPDNSLASAALGRRWATQVRRSAAMAPKT